MHRLRPVSILPPVVRVDEQGDASPTTSEVRVQAIFATLMASEIANFADGSLTLPIRQSWPTADRGAALSQDSRAHRSRPRTHAERQAGTPWMLSARGSEEASVPDPRSNT